MRARFLGALGLRGRIIGAVLIASVATLIVAALALLGPLEASLRNAEKTTLKQEFAGTRGTAVFESHANDPGEVSYALTPPSSSTRPQGTGGAAITANSGATAREEDKLYKDGVRGPGPPGQGGAEPPVVHGRGGGGPAGVSGRVGAELAHRRRRPQPRHRQTGSARRRGGGVSHGTSCLLGGLDRRYPGRPGGDPVHDRGVDPGHPEHWVLVVRKPLDTLSDAVSTVRRAFVYAALAGLALTLLLGIPLSATIVRRLGRLRQAALQLAANGPPVDVRRGPSPRRGGRSGPRVRPDAAAAPAAGGGPPRVRRDRVARAAHAAGLPRRDARAARRRSRRAAVRTSTTPARCSIGPEPSRAGCRGWRQICST